MQKVAATGLSFPGLYKRNGVFVFRKAIPNELRPIMGKREHVESLRTGCLNEALLRYATARDALSTELADARQGRRPRQELPDKEIIRATADNLGISYCPVEAFTTGFDVNDPIGSLRPLVQNFDHWKSIGSPLDIRFDALFGSMPIELSFRELLENYENSTKAERAGLNAREIDRMLAPKRLAVRIFEQSAFCQDAKSVTRADALKLRQVLIDAVFAGSIKSSTANKRLGDLRVIFAAAIQNDLLREPNPFLGLRLPAENGCRNSYSVAFVREQLLPNLEGLSLECRAMLWAAIDTGAHFKELCGLTENDIRINDPIPHIRIEPNAIRRLKNASRRRELPLVGLALRAFRAFPKGFPSYRRSKGPEAASANCNKFLLGNNLIEPAMFRGGSERPQTTYSFRHLFKDRLRNASIHDSVQDRLMGHRTPGMGQHYGVGHSLEALRAELNKIAFDFTAETRGPSIDLEASDGN